MNLAEALAKDIFDTWKVGQGKHEDMKWEDFSSKIIWLDDVKKHELPIITAWLDSVVLTDEEIKGAYRRCKAIDFLKSVKGFAIERALLQAFKDKLKQEMEK